MSTPNLDGLEQKIDQGKLKVGNQVLASTGLPSTPSQVLAVDTGGKLAATYPLTAVQPDNTAVVLDLTTSGLEGVLTGSVVAAGSSTVTQKGFLRILVTDPTGIGASTGAYYIPFGILA